MSARTLAQNQAQALRAHRIAQIETDLDLGISPAQIAADQGTTVAALERQMHRAGRHDLARRLGPGRDRRDYKRRYDDARSHPCIDCGGTASRYSQARCRTCENKRRAKAS